MTTARIPNASEVEASDSNNILERVYKIEGTSTEYVVSLKSFPDGRLILQDKEFIWILANEKPQGFTIAASLNIQDVVRIGYDFCDMKVLTDHMLAFKTDYKCVANKIHIWDPSLSPAAVCRASLSSSKNSRIDQYAVIKDSIETNDTYLITAHPEQNLSLWDIKTLNEVPIEPTKNLKNQTLVPGNFAWFEDSFLFRFFCMTIDSQTPKIARQIAYNVSFLADKISWVSSDYFVMSGEYKEIILIDKDKKIDTYHFNKKVIDILPLKNSNYFFCSTYGELNLLEIKDSKIALVTKVLIHSKLKYEFTVFPNGDVAAVHGVESQKLSKYTQWIDHSLHFYRFAELAPYRNNFSIELATTKEILKNRLPADMAKKICDYLPEFQYYKSCKKFGVFKTTTQAEECKELSVPSPVPSY